MEEFLAYMKIDVGGQLESRKLQSELNCPGGQIVMHRLSKRIRDNSSSKIASIPLILEGEVASLSAAALYTTAAVPT